MVFYRGKALWKSFTPIVVGFQPTLRIVIARVRCEAISDLLTVTTGIAAPQIAWGSQ